MRRQLRDENVTVDNQAARHEDGMCRRLSKRRLIGLQAYIRVLDKRFVEMVGTNAAFAQRYEMLGSMSGVDQILAYKLIELLPELAKYSC